LFTPRI